MKTKRKITPFIIVIIVLLAILIITVVAAFIVGPKYKYNASFMDPTSLHYFNKEVLTPAQISTVEAHYTSNTQTCAWDNQGYLVVQEVNSVGNIYKITGFSRYWPSLFYKYSLVPPTEIFGQTDNACLYIKGYTLYVMEGMTRVYLHIDMTLEKAYQYTEFVKSLGFTLDETGDNDWNVYDYIYDAKNEDNIEVAVLYDKSPAETNKSCIMITIYFDEGENE